MDFLEAAGQRLEQERIEGSAPALVFLHEGLGSVSLWKDFPRAAAEATGCAALVYSRRGYGRSEPREPPWPLRFMHDEALRVLPAVLDEAGVEDAILVGHSDGASIALIYAGAIGLRVRGVVAMAPHVMVEEICVEAITAVRAEYEAAGSKLRERLARHHADVDGAFQGWAGVWLDPGFLRWDLRGYLPGVRVPLLVIQGEDDAYGTLAQVDEIERGVAGPVERVILPACGHSPHRDRRDETLAAIARFVRGLDTPAAPGPT
jgi:pimeloyl-ACP methyl ester carboxylesterase